MGTVPVYSRWSRASGIAGRVRCGCPTRLRLSSTPSPVWSALSPVSRWGGSCWAWRCTLPTRSPVGEAGSRSCARPVPRAGAATARRRRRLGRGCRSRRGRLRPRRRRGAGAAARAAHARRELQGRAADRHARGRGRGRVRAGRRGPAFALRRRRAELGPSTASRALRVRRPACRRRDLPARSQGRAGAPLPDPRRRRLRRAEVPRAYARDVLPLAADQPRPAGRGARLLPCRLWPAGDPRRRPARRVRAEQRAARALLARLVGAGAAILAATFEPVTGTAVPGRPARDLLHGHERRADRGRHRARAGDLPQECCSGAGERAGERSGADA